MFNDENVKKSTIAGAIYVVCFVCIIGALVMGVIFSIGDLGGAEQEAVQPETAPTVKYEKVEEATVVPVIEIEKQNTCEHNWIISDEYLTLIRTVNLECVASEGIEKVYLTRYRGAFDHDDSAPAPRATPCFAHSTASIPVGVRPPCT